MAGYKGAGLALTFVARWHAQWCAVWSRCVDFNANRTKSPIQAFVVALDPSRFQPIEHFKAEVDRHIRELRSTKPLPGQSVRLPGEQRAQRRDDRLRNGIPLAPELLSQLDKLAAELSIKPLRERT